MAGMIVPFSEQIEAGASATKSVSGGQLAEARSILGLSKGESGDRTALNRARRKRALECHPDKVLPGRKEWAKKEWLKLDEAFNLLLRQL